MLPFLADDMRDMVISILERFLKEDPKKLTVSQVLTLASNISDSKLHKEPADIDIGYVASSVLKGLKKAGKVSEKDVNTIKLDTKRFLIQLVIKLLAKAPIRYGLVRNLSWMQPSNIVREDSSSAKHSLRQCLDYMVSKKRVKKEDVDCILRQYGEFVSDKTSCAKFLSFNRESDRLDTLYFSALSKEEKWKDLWDIVKEVMLLSHGQASVERGFSINKEIMTDNMQCKTLVAQRVITDHLRSVGGASQVFITKTLLVNAASARSRYEEHLRQEKKKKEQEEVSKKRKLLIDEVEDLKAKKRRLELCAKDMLKSSEQLAEQAEKTEKFTFLAKSNALCRSAKEKSEEALAMESQIDQKLLEIKSA